MQSISANLNSLSVSSSLSSFLLFTNTLSELKLYNPGSKTLAIALSVLDSSGFKGVAKLNVFNPVQKNPLFSFPFRNTIRLNSDSSVSSGKRVSNLTRASFVVEKFLTEIETGTLQILFIKKEKVKCNEIIVINKQTDYLGNH